MKSRKNLWILIIGMSLSFGNTAVQGQPPPIELPQIVLTAKHRETVTPPGASSTTRLVGVRSSNTSVATASPFRNNQVEIVAVAPGNTTVEFFDSAKGQKYIQPVWVQAANATGGGGAGYDPGKTQLPQVTMRIKHTENITVPGAGRHQLSSVVSSNPSVATARTNTANTIQVYAKALGDTWVDFVDNATGTTYQIHVWVTATGGKPPANSGSNQNPKPKAVVAGPIVKGLDPCLVGDWVSESVAYMANERGGSGVHLSIERNGKITLDYTGMTPIDQVTADGELVSRSIYSGKAVYQITPYPGGWKVKVISNEITIRRKDGSEEKQDDYGGPGAVLVPRLITCTSDTLTFKLAVYKRKSQ